ncbi:MAG: hypothetical protein FWC72_05125 [Oscillospiraceae bacterium]|nr:hypothetical protein [Oscillospiraceae bacterium]
MRHIATSLKGSQFLTAEAERKVYCWNLDTFKRVSEFETILSFGGDRLAITEDGARCVAADYQKYGVSVYDTLTGSLIWQRTDIKRAQFVSFDPSNENLYIGSDEKPMTVIDRYTGEDIEKLRSIRKIYFDLLSLKQLRLKNRTLVLCDGNKIVSPTFAFLDIQATGVGVALSAVGSDLLYYDYKNQKITWKIAPEDEAHFIKLAYSEKHKTLYAVLCKYGDSRTVPYYILYGISALDGKVKFIFPLPPKSCEFDFAQESTKLICSSGEIYELSDSMADLIYQFDWD